MVDREEILVQAGRRYEDYLRALVTGEPFFPLALRLGKTRRAGDYAGRRREVAAFREAAASLGLQVDWREVNDRRFGQHEWPEAARFTEESVFLRALGKTVEVRAFREDVARIRAGCPELENWLPGNVRAIVAHRGDWSALLRVVRWFLTNPRPNLYLRQLPVEGVDTKFFEQHQAILDALLLHSMPPGQIATDAGSFEERHGLRVEERRFVRLRFLDDALRRARGFPAALEHFLVPLPAFRALGLANTRVVLTENLRNFLALPRLPGAVAVFGGGYAIEGLHGTPWLAASEIFYWGDLDAHGFELLGRLRASFPQTRAVLMDAGTWRRFRPLAVPGSSPSSWTPAGLTVEECELREELISGGLRLEQERLPFPFVAAELAARLSANDANN